MVSFRLVHGRILSLMINCIQYELQSDFAAFQVGHLQNACNEMKPALSSHEGKSGCHHQDVSTLYTVISPQSGDLKN